MLSTLVEGAGHRPAAEQGGGEAHTLLVRKAHNLDREWQPLATPVQISDAGDRRDDAERTVPFAGVAHRIVMRADHQARQVRPLALVAAADIADGVEMRAHPGLTHPRQDQIGGLVVLFGQKNPRQMLRRFGDRSERVDPRHDLFAER